MTRSRISIVILSVLVLSGAILMVLANSGGFICDTSKNTQQVVFVSNCETETTSSFLNGKTFCFNPQTQVCIDVSRRVFMLDAIGLSLFLLGCVLSSIWFCKDFCCSRN